MTKSTEPNSDVQGDIEKINIPSAFDRIEEKWSPHIAARINGQEVRLAKIEGAFEWHHHADADEAFMVVKGAFDMRLRENNRERTVAMAQGDLIVIPAGVEHMPVADAECWIMLIEPAGTLNTGEKETARSRHNLPEL